MHVFHRPLPPLSEFVEFFWMIVGGQTPRKEQVLPSGTIELVINLDDDAVHIHDRVRPERYKRLSGTIVSGPYSRVFICNALQHQAMLGVHFRPGGAFPFLGLPLAELANVHLDLKDLWGVRASDLRERLCIARTARQRFQIMERALMDRLRGSPKPHPALQVALPLLGSAGTGASIRDVSHEVGLSQRRFIELFTAQVGLRPKMLCRILRFQRARALAEQLETRPAFSAEPPKASSTDWAGLACACGYYDQSHLIHDFQEFSDSSPAEYLHRHRSADWLKDSHVPMPE